MKLLVTKFEQLENLATHLLGNLGDAKWLCGYANAREAVSYLSFAKDSISFKQTHLSEFRADCRLTYDPRKGVIVYNGRNYDSQKKLDGNVGIGQASEVINQFLKSFNVKNDNSIIYEYYDYDPYGADQWFGLADLAEVKKHFSHLESSSSFIAEFGDFAYALGSDAIKLCSFYLADTDKIFNKVKKIADWVLKNK